MSQTSAEEAINVILQAELTPIEHNVLVDFVQQAVSPDVAAREILKRVKARSDAAAGCSVEEALREFKSDWHRLVAAGTY